MNTNDWKAVIPLAKGYVHPQGFTFKGPHWALVENGRIVAIDSDRAFLESLL